MAIGVALDTEILLWNGTSKPAADVSSGDILAGENGPAEVEKARTVESVCSVMHGAVFGGLVVGIDTVLPVVRYHTDNRETYNSYTTAHRFSRPSSTSHKCIGLSLGSAEFRNTKSAFDPFLLGWMSTSRRRKDKHGNVMMLIQHPEVKERITKLLDKYNAKYDVRECNKSKKHKEEIMFLADDSILYSLALDCSNYMFNYAARLCKSMRAEFLAGCVCASYVKDGMIYSQAHARAKSSLKSFVSIDNFLMASRTLGVKAWSRSSSTPSYHKSWLNITSNIDWLDIPDSLKISNRYCNGLTKIELRTSGTETHKVRDIIVGSDVYMTSSGIKISSLREKPY